MTDINDAVEAIFQAANRDLPTTITLEHAHAILTAIRAGRIPTVPKETAEEVQALRDARDANELSSDYIHECRIRLKEAGVPEAAFFDDFVANAVVLWKRAEADRDAAMAEVERVTKERDLERRSVDRLSHDHKLGLARIEGLLAGGDALSTKLAQAEKDKGEAFDEATRLRIRTEAYEARIACLSAKLKEAKGLLEQAARYVELHKTMSGYDPATDLSGILTAFLKEQP